MKNNNKYSNKKAFSFMELAIVMAIIGALAGGIIGGQKLVEMGALSGARADTRTSPVVSTDGLVLWLDTTSKKSFNKAEAKNGTPITNWYDINLKLNDPINFTQATTANKPIYTTKAIGRLPALVFSDDVFTSVNSIGIDRIISEIGEITIFVVAKNDIITANFDGLIFFWNGSGANRVGFDHDATNIYFNYGICCGTDARISANLAPYKSKWSIYAGIRKSDTAQIKVNGVSVAGPTASSINSIPHSSSNQLTIGLGTGDRFSGGMAEIIIFNRGLSASEVADIEVYLSQKWKIKLQ